MEGILVGVFGTDSETKTEVESSLGKKSEAEGTIIYHRTDSGKKISLLDDSQFPRRIQGYAKIASIVDHALYFYPRSGKLSAADGELAVLLESFSLAGTIEVVDSGGSADTARAALRGTAVGEYPVEERSSVSSVLNVAGIGRRRDPPAGGTLVSIDRAFAVKGVGTVVLGFVLSGSVAIHDKLRLISGREGLRADVKGIQINDEDSDSAGRGIRVGLSLRGVEPGDLEKTNWLDDGTFTVSDELRLQFRKSPFYKPSVFSRDMHLQLPGEMLTAWIGDGAADEELKVKLQNPAPVWDGMHSAVVDLNAKSLRIAGGCVCKP